MKKLESKAVILDIDGTLVDSNYQHVIAWQRAFRECGFNVAGWRIHRGIGMGGDQLVTLLAGEKAESDSGDDIREAEGRFYAELMPEVRPFEDAHESILKLNEQGFELVLSSSAKEDEVDHYVELLDAEDLISGVTSSADVSSTKPDPDLIEVAIEMSGARASEAVMIGDSVWDVKAAGRADLETIGLLCGGFGEAELLDAGAVRTVDSIGDIAVQLSLLPP